jgi:hypothetical protein
MLSAAIFAMSSPALMSGVRIPRAVVPVTLTEVFVANIVGILFCELSERMFMGCPP